MVELQWQMSVSLFSRNHYRGASSQPASEPRVHKYLVSIHLYRQHLSHKILIEICLKGEMFASLKCT